MGLEIAGGCCATGFTTRVISIVGVFRPLLLVIIDGLMHLAKIWAKNHSPVLSGFRMNNVQVHRKASNINSHSNSQSTNRSNRNTLPTQLDSTAHPALGGLYS